MKMDQNRIQQNVNESEQMGYKIMLCRLEMEIEIFVLPFLRRIITLSMVHQTLWFTFSVSICLKADEKTALKCQVITVHLDNKLFTLTQRLVL